MFKMCTYYIGMVGASYSEVTSPVSTVLQGHNVSMLSYASTSAGLSDKRRHPLFGRLVPSDVGQVMIRVPCI
jgi:ABC-type branched-subunit amino acid transport system substrate-binding protein